MLKYSKVSMVKTNNGPSAKEVKEVCHYERSVAS